MDMYWCNDGLQQMSVPGSVPGCGTFDHHLGQPLVPQGGRLLGRCLGVWRGGGSGGGLWGGLEDATPALDLTWVDNSNYQGIK